MKSKLFYCLLCCSLSLFSQQPKELRAVKITNVDSNVMFSDQAIADAMDYLASIGVNVILPVVWNGAYTQYQSNVMDSIFGVSIHTQFTGRDPLERLIIEAHRVGIEVYPWFEYGFAAWYSGSGTATGGHIIKKFPQWASRTSDGQICKKNGFDWMATINPDVQNFINLLVKEVITKYDVDGVEFSDRIPALPVECGYDSVTVALYKAEHNGNLPPANFSDPLWMRWRANKMNQWYADVRALIKNHNKNIFVSSSPSIYPWSYQEYLQDCQTWIDLGIADHYIPQLYRYNFSDYKYELNKAVAQVGNSLHILFPGILMNIGTGTNEYVMSVDYLLNALKENRTLGVKGEAFFYYEGLRKNNNRLGDTLKATFYKERAIVPERGDYEWRFPAAIANEDDSTVNKIGAWQIYQMKGFKGAIVRTNDSVASSLTYTFNIPFAAFYDVYTFRTPNTPWSKQAYYTVYSKTDSTTVLVDQSDLTKKGWYKIATVQLDSGMKKVITLDNRNNEPGKYTVADAAMIMINRILSPNQTTSVKKSEQLKSNSIEFRFIQNYPNPFNPVTTIFYTIPLQDANTQVVLKIYDVIGREVATLVNEKKSAGNYSVIFNSNNITAGITSGVYFAKLQFGEKIFLRKMILMK